MTNINAYTSKMEVQKFIGVMNYYHNMWARRSHMLAPLTRITSTRVNFKWTKIKQDDFKKIKRIVARDTLSTYSDFNEEFKIHTNAIKLQLGAVII